MGTPFQEINDSLTWFSRRNAYCSLFSGPTIGTDDSYSPTTAGVNCYSCLDTFETEKAFPGRLHLLDVEGDNGANLLPTEAQVSADEMGPEYFEQRRDSVKE